ncbi:hypothetical protein [Sulfuracidifex tepidarius]|uniref:Uncharacterized protein n=1 Tax=Sulfuracidifex tepidarius TaxID=1294262 RepID=A0A510DSN6_9CREN|nr:hypothetical protein [Sulfuracidifex tepidarius]BBG23216.1 hypothetical protein IC006_0500 [Sulfuracidifex tepidarius]BBG25953.1 hypothetical protein IC007_0458 [Sulfuracidifex tepidarius]
MDNLHDKFQALQERGFSSTCEDMRKCLRRDRRLTFKGEIDVYFEILLGEEFFEEVLHESYTQIRDSILTKELGDDLWLFYAVLPYEIRFYYENGFMWSRKIYEMLRSDPSLMELLKKEHSIDNVIDQIVKRVIDREENIRLLETNDMKVQYEFLRALCGVALILSSLDCPKKLNL